MTLTALQPFIWNVTECRCLKNATKLQNAASESVNHFVTFLNILLIRHLHFPTFCFVL